MKRTAGLHWRGAVLFETAISLSLILLLLFGSIQLMIVGYYQVTLDAATFVHNRAIALGVPSGMVTSKVDSPFSSVIAMAPISVSGTPAPAPFFGVSGVMYGSSSIGQRSGGVSMLLPQQASATESITSAFATITSSALESMVMDICPHFCMANGGFGSGSTQGTAIPYFGSIDDNSPYVGGFAFMKTCGTYDIDGTSYNNTLTTPNQWDTCPAGQTVWRGMSMGPQLTSQNYEFQLPGMQAPAPTGSTPTFTPVAGTFFVAFCHRRFYAYIANQLANWPAIPVAGSDLNNFLLTLFHGYAPDGTTSPGELIYAVRPSPVLASGWDDTSMFDPPSGGAHPFEGNENEGWGCWQY